jgi:glycyl-tRNA synthetase beta chain
MSTLFVEIGCEEIPARLQTKAIADLSDGLCRRLAALGFTAVPGRLAVSPRHMAVEVNSLETVLPDSKAERRGPRKDASDKAIEGFCQSSGLSRDQLITRETEKGTFHFAVIQRKGVVLEECLQAVIEKTLSEFPWPKSQRWAETNLTWVRPLHAVNVLLDGEPVAGQIDLGGSMSIAFGSSATGHPFYPADPVFLSDFDSYVCAMENVYVLVDHAVRKARIAAQLGKVASSKQLYPVTDDNLLDEVTGLVEWPNVIFGQIEPDFMSLPPEVLLTSMRVHQKFFALSPTGEADNLAPYFMTVANRRSDPLNDKLIAAGNERVLRARLADAQFFYEQDKHTPLDGKAQKLALVTFYEGLGSVANKTERMTALAEAIAKRLPAADPGTARRAAALSKTDLVTEMVGEFPELQGIMGVYYAAAVGETADVVDALKQHYSPQGPSDAIPASLYGQIVALADKVDTLAGFFGIGVKPTGSRDPFALRRAALGILRIIDEGNLDLSLDVLLADAAALHKAAGHYNESAISDTDLPAFILDRLRVKLRESGVSHDVVAAVLAMVPPGGIGDVRLWVRLSTALDSFLSSDEGKLLAGGWRRVSSILASEEKKTNGLTVNVNEDLFADHTETDLYHAIQLLPDAAGQDEAAIKSVMQGLAALSGPIDRFFDAVVVNAEEDSVRANRLSLLVAVRAKMLGIADFSQLEG